MHIVFDFDGVIRDPTTNEPMEGAIKSLLKLGQKNKITILTANNIGFVQQWMFDKCKKAVGVVDKVTNIKVNGDLYIDDKGYKFINWEECSNYINSIN